MYTHAQAFLTSVDTLHVSARLQLRAAVGEPVNGVCFQGLLCKAVLVWVAHVQRVDMARGHTAFMRVGNCSNTGEKARAI